MEALPHNLIFYFMFTSLTGEEAEVTPPVLYSKSHNQRIVKNY